MIETVALVIAAVALGLSVAALLLAWTTRRFAGEYAHKHLPVAPRSPEPVDERELHLGPPRATGERRRDDLGPAARHRAPDDARARRRDADDLATTQLAAQPRVPSGATRAEPAEEQALGGSPQRYERLQRSRDAREAADTGDLPATVASPAAHPRRPGNGPNFREPAPRTAAAPMLPPPGRIDRDR